MLNWQKVKRKMKNGYVSNLRGNMTQHIDVSPLTFSFLRNYQLSDVKTP